MVLKMSLSASSRPDSHASRHARLWTPEASAADHPAPRSLPMSFRLFEWVGK